MSVFQGSRELYVPIPPERSPKYMISYSYSNGDSFFSATPESISERPRLDFISILSLSQRLGIDFLPIQWSPALDSVGLGGQAEIRQLPINLQMSFAFRRVASGIESEDVQFRVFSALASELLILGHPQMRNHPNIIRLEGVCWDIMPKAQQIWPVLVFEKTQHGDLHRFMNSGMGRGLSFDDRLKLCADILVAVTDMHSQRIIHGDLKPQNVLIFSKSSVEFVAKVSDFGCSTFFAKDDDMISLPMSYPWTAPEYHHRKHTLLNATKMDIYSVAMLCFWLLFNERLADPAGLSLGFHGDKDGLKASTQPNSKRQVEDLLHFLKINDVLHDTAYQLLDESDITPERKSSLDQFFRSNLSSEATKRTTDPKQLLEILDPNRIVSTQKPAIEIQLAVEREFKVAQSLPQLYMADHRIRPYVTACLRERVLQNHSQQAAFELAFCYKTGFGVVKDDIELNRFLSLSSRLPQELDHEIGLCINKSREPLFQQGSFRDLWSQGHIAVEESPRYVFESQQLVDFETDRRREISDARELLGNSSQVVVNLKEILSLALFEAGSWEKSLDLTHEVMQMRTEELGEDHPDTLAIVGDFASMLWFQGRFDEAEKYQMHACDTSRRVLGGEHPSTLTSTSNLASVLRSQRRLGEAEALELQVIELRKRLLGDEHPDTLAVMSNLASTLLEQERWKDAELLFDEVIKKREKVLDKDHQDTLTSMSNRAIVYMQQQRWEKAANEINHVIEKRKEIFGEKHPFTLTALGILVSVYESEQNLEEAEHQQLEIIALSKEVLGEEHPDTTERVSYLASMYEDQERWKEAEDLLVEVVAIRRKVLGEDDPETLSSIMALALARSHEHEWQDVEPLFTEAIEGRKAVLGPESYLTLEAMNSLASLYTLNDLWDEAEKIQKLIVEGMSNTMGAESSDTLTAMSNLAMTLGNQGRNKEAEKLEVHVMKTSVRVLGDEHEDTIMSKNNLASTYRQQGRLSEAETLERQVVEISTRVLGEGDMDTLGYTGNLAHTLRLQGRSEEAFRLMGQVEALWTRVFGRNHEGTKDASAVLELWHIEDGMKY